MFYRPVTILNDLDTQSQVCLMVALIDNKQEGIQYKIIVIRKCKYFRSMIVQGVSNSQGDWRSSTGTYTDKNRFLLIPV